jgi:hypothetical protein
LLISILNLALSTINYPRRKGRTMPTYIAIVTKANNTTKLYNPYMQFNAPLLFNVLFVATAATLVALAAVVLLFAFASYLREASSPLNVLRGPKCHSWVFGHLGSGADTTRAIEDWFAQYGHAIVIRAAFGVGIFFARRMSLITPNRRAD